jgi:uncharacterized protein YukE
MGLSLQDLEKEIARLKAENQKLQANGTAAREFKVETGEYNGAPTLAFSGNFKPWRKGARSIAAILQNADKVKKAIKECGISV